MKVLIPIIYHELTHCIARAFEEEGHEVMVVDWRQHGKESNKHKVEPMCIAAAKQFKPEFAFCQFQSPGLIGHAFPKYLNTIGCFSVNWSGDVRHPLPSWYKELASFFTVTSFTNCTDVDEIRAMGNRSEFLQIGYDERIYNTEGAGERSGVVFLGNNYSGYKFAESQGRREMAQALAEAYPDEFTAYGMSWEGVIPERNVGGYVREPGDADILKRSLVAVGWDHFHRPGFASDRLLRATACGCATVNQYYEGIEQEHPDVVAVRSIADMVEAVGHALKHPVESGMIGDLCAHNTLKQHRWNERVKQMMTWL